MLFDGDSLTATLWNYSHPCMFTGICGVPCTIAGARAIHQRHFTKHSLVSKRFTSFKRIGQIWAGWMKEKSKNSFNANQAKLSVKFQYLRSTYWLCRWFLRILFLVLKLFLWSWMYLCKCKVHFHWEMALQEKCGGARSVTPQRRGRIHGPLWGWQKILLRWCSRQRGHDLLGRYPCDTRTRNSNYGTIFQYNVRRGEENAFYSLSTLYFDGSERLWLLRPSSTSDSCHIPTIWLWGNLAPPHLRSPYVSGVAEDLAYHVPQLYCLSHGWVCDLRLFNQQASPDLC